MSESKHTVNINSLIIATPTDQVVIKGLNTISKMCDILSEHFEDALNSFKNKNKIIVDQA